MGLRYSQCLDPDNVDSEYNDQVLLSRQSYCPHPCYDHHGSSEEEEDCETEPRQCLTHLSSSNMIISDEYTGKTGDALLIYNVVNVLFGEPEVREMTSGMYTVCDIKCHQCHKLLGWKYLKSHQTSQKFKEQRYILEINNMKVVA
ncbi:hypothetical protein OGAPHI_001791 [Ogataea philodendri]|uniref:Protein yippee-like n=1 Tax=Ogataea philodendri TaxID=1378263 RepID=A0A9P8PAZ9_9ASCO|nr:uncharacterized protein OGAPHI_001791 [Ogataea philodendri]KAH3668037.1 hypothetical protein OGAPHI_001791 [Ogataea philodendri]